jgi:hypothetical protein
MMVHHSTPVNFRLVEWPKSQASHLMFFSVDKLRYDLTPLLDFIAKKIFDTNKAFVYSTTFSLVNLVAPQSSVSYGLATPPPPKLSTFHPLSITFAFTTRNTYLARKYPNYSVRPVPYVTTWGNTLVGATDFSTINIPKDVLMKVGLSGNLTMREMKWLYMALGAFTKGFVQRSDYYNPNGKFRYPESALEIDYTMYFHKTIQHAFKHIEYGYWGYLKDMWEVAPNLIHEDTATDHYCAYYCLNLRKYYRKYKTKNIKDIENKVEAFMESGVLDIIQSLDVQTDYLDDSVSDSLAFTTVSKLLEEVDINEFDFTDIKGAVRNILKGTFRR